MQKTTRLALLLVAALVLGVTVNSQDPPKQKADWRKASPSLQFLAAHLPGDEQDFYEFSVMDLLTEFGRRGEVSVRYDSRQITPLPKLSMRGVKEANKLVMFEMCQRALDSNGLTLFPEAGASRSFFVDANYNACEHAPLVKEEEVAGLAPAEWATVLYTLQGGNPSTVVAMAQAVTTQQGGRIQHATGEKTVLIVDRASNVVRILEVMHKVDTPREDPKTVPYQRAAKTPLFELVKSLQVFLDRYAKEINVPAGSFYVSWEHDSKLLIGMVPQAVCSFLDASVDAAEKGAQLAKEERELSGPNFICFELPVPSTHKAAAIEASLRMLFEPELVAGDLRTLVKGDERKSVVIRCRKWLENSLRDSFDTLLK